MTKVEAVLFDFGGTLFDFDPNNVEIWTQVAAQFGKTITPDDSKLLQGLVDQAEAFDRLMLTKSIRLGRDIPEEEWLKLNTIVLTAIEISDPSAIRAVQEAFTAREGCYRIFPDTKQTLNDLKQLGKRIGIVSNSTPKGATNRRPILQKHGILEYFETIILSSEVGIAKPDREIFEIALGDFGLEDPQRVWHVGDFFGADVVGARNAGIIPVLIDPTGLRNADCLCVHTLSEVVSLLREFELDNWVN
ncbi:MAG: HAD family hydrolase [Candidatus Hodarchaeales archaeon]|jgi:putative hydrolase of the HAD superfamily